MKNKIKYIFFYTAILLLVLAGCAEVSNEAYDEAIDNGLEELRIENYEKAVDYFELALAEESDDEQAEILLTQTQGYVEVMNYFEQEKYDEATEKAELLLSVEDGSGYLELKTSQLIDEIKVIQEAKAAAEEKDQAELAETELFEEFKGVYATFAMGIYEWPVDYLFIMGDDFIIDGYEQTGLYVREIKDKKFDGDTLILETVLEDESSNSEKQYMVDLSSDNESEKILSLKTGEILYPITVDDAIKTNFSLINGSFSILEDLRLYDQEVTQPISYSNTEVLNDYSAKEIEYARVWLNTIGNEGVIELNVFKEKAGSIINHYDDNSPVYPEDVTVITGYATADGMITYSENGDGTINIYPVPSHWHASPEELPDLYEEILNPTKIYLEPMEDKKLLQLIQMMNIRY